MAGRGSKERVIEPEHASVLKAQASVLGVPERVYLETTPQDRNVRKARYVAALKRRAKEQGEDPNEAVREFMKTFPTIEGSLKKTNSAEIKAKIKKREKAPEAPVPPYVEKETPDGKSVKVYHNHGDMPPAQPNPHRRDGMTISDIAELEKPVLVDDLVGDRPPRTLADLHARWPLGSNPEFFLRVVRTKPKRWQGIDTAGFITNLAGIRVDEQYIAQSFGGNEYKLQLYGPDPRGKEDVEGRVVIKELTEPITLTIPGLPPNVMAIPGVIPQEGNSMMNGNPMMPFGPTAPVTDAEAKMHKNSIDFFSANNQRILEESRRREKSMMEANSSVLDYVTKTQEQQKELDREERRRRDEENKARIEEERKERVRAEQRAAELASTTEEKKQQYGDAIMKMVEKLGPNHEAEVTRLSQYFQSQLDGERRSSQAIIQGMRERHEGDLRRSDERYRDMESQYRAMLEQERSTSQTTLNTERGQWQQRERDVRDDMNRQMQNERDMSKQRIEDLKERQRESLEQLTKAHERELRVIKESFDTKLTVKDETHQMTMLHLNERLEDAKSDVERAREEAEEAKDLPRQLEKMEATAAVLGYEKKDADQPKSAWERLALMGGSALSQLASNAPQIMESIQEQRQQRALAAATQVRQMQPAGPPRPVPQPHPGSTEQRATRGAQWSAQNAPRRAPPEQEVPGFQPQPAPSPVKTEVRTSEPSELLQNPATSEVIPEDLSESSGSSEGSVPIPEKFTKVFPKEAVVGFLSQLEMQIASQGNPEGFALLFLNSYADGAKQMSANFTPEDIFEAVEGMPNGELSPIVRADGRKWVAKFYASLAKEVKKLGD